MSIVLIASNVQIFSHYTEISSYLYLLSEVLEGFQPWQQFRGLSPHPGMGPQTPHGLRPPFYPGGMQRPPHPESSQNKARYA